MDEEKPKHTEHNCHPMGELIDVSSKKFHKSTMVPVSQLSSPRLDSIRLSEIPQLMLQEAHLPMASPSMESAHKSLALDISTTSIQNQYSKQRYQPALRGRTTVRSSAPGHGSSRYRADHSPIYPSTLKVELLHKDMFDKQAQEEHEEKSA